MAGRRASRRLRGRARSLKVRGGFAPTAFMRAPKPKDGFKSFRREGRGDVDIPKIKKLLFSNPKKRRSKNVEFSEAVQFENATEKETIVTEEREVEYAPILSNRGLYQVLQAVGNIAQRTRTKGGSPNKIPPSGGGKSEGFGLFSKKSLPEGSTLVSKITLGRNAFPSKAIATEAKARVYGSEQMESNLLRTSPAFSQRFVGIGETSNMLIPMQFADDAYLRMSMMQYFSRGASNTVSNTMIADMYDAPTTPSPITSATYSGGYGRRTYVPFRTESQFTITNVNRTLPMKARIHIVQLKNEGSNSDTSPLILNPANVMNGCLDSMPTNNKIDTAVTEHAMRQTGSLSHVVWGLTSTEFASATGNYEAKTATGFPISSSPVFEERFNVLKTLNFNVAAGSSRRVELINHINRCYTRFGKMSAIMSGSINSGLNTRLFLLVEAHGQPDTPFYRAVRTGDNTEPTREWATAKSAPANFYMELDMDCVWPIETSLYRGSSSGGITYKRSFIDVSNETAVDKTFHTTDIIESESDLSATVTSGYIVPVTSEKEVVGMQVRAAEKSETP